MSVHDDQENPLRQTSESSGASPPVVALPAKRAPGIVLLRWLPIAVILVLACFGTMAVINSIMPPP